MVAQTGQVHESYPPQKFSRYRSVRKASAQVTQHVTEVPPLPSNVPNSINNSQNESIRRSMSRYRKTGASKVNNTAPPPIPALPLPTEYTNSLNGRGGLIKNQQDTPTSSRPSTSVSPPSRPTPQSSRPSSNYRNDDSHYQPYATRPSQQSSRPSSNYQNNDAHYQPHSNQREPSSRDPIKRLSEQYNVGRADQVQDEGPSQHRIPPSPAIRRFSHDDTPAGLNILHNTLNERQANELAMEKYLAKDSAKKNVKEKGGLFSRLKWYDIDGSDRSSREKKPFKISPPMPCESTELPTPVAGGPGVDAPVSAVNAGERKVLVICNEAFIQLPITPTTQVQDLIFSAANCLSVEISPASAIIMESFKSLGLQRPLRKYEHVRDVMNSWDTDAQNHLEVVPKPEESVLESLHVRSAPKKQPPDVSFELYHSQRHGKWEKRFITLRTDGQVTMSKKQGGESTNICHVSDFDIYTPTRREYKSLKPPKRACFAIKSQQKSAMFLSTDNFVHYFCTNHDDVGSGWHRAVQQWRSWYLVNVLGAGVKEDKVFSSAPAGMETDNSLADPHRMSMTPYQLGSFKPLLDLDILTFDNVPDPEIPPEEEPPKQPVKAKKKPKVKSPPMSRAATTRHTKPPNPLASAPSSPTRPTTSSKAVKQRLRSRTVTSTHTKKEAAPPEVEPFAASSLLGRAYTQRQNAMRDREKEEAENGPFIATGLLHNLRSTNNSTAPSPTSQAFPADVFQSLPNSGPSSRENTMAAEYSAPSDARSFRAGAKSIRQPKKPLVDLSPTYQEAPQHVRRGRGVAPIQGVPLVDIATGPEVHPNAIVIPSATTWRKPTAAASHTTDSSAGVGMHAAGRQRSNTTRSTRPSTSARESPFLANGLVARSTTMAQGSARTGRGVATGDRSGNSRPLVEMSQSSRFGDGSLLRSMERHGHGNGNGNGRDGHHGIDHERRVERSVYVGEGY
ncbi:hypothetical protein FQN57_000694 [Myotisia sp. PD_48]|nr:hypothetical protein FQN57_000694 [Myotisia sp. PD_48]